jgi:hypothetical protein
MCRVRHHRRHVVVGAAVHRMSAGRLVCAQSTLPPTGIETAGRRMACLLDGRRCPVVAPDARTHAASRCQYVVAIGVGPRSGKSARWAPGHG